MRHLMFSYFSRVWIKKTQIFCQNENALTRKFFLTRKLKFFQLATCTLHFLRMPQQFFNGIEAFIASFYSILAIFIEKNTKFFFVLVRIKLFHACSPDCRGDDETGK
jgi:hypothetical protein